MQLEKDGINGNTWIVPFSLPFFGVYVKRWYMIWDGRSWKKLLMLYNARQVGVFPIFSHPSLPFPILPSFSFPGFQFHSFQKKGINVISSLIVKHCK